MAMLREMAPGSMAFAAFREALTAANLPTQDLHSEPFRYFVWNDAAWGGVGVGDDALLRSIIVPPEARGRGLGAALTQALAARAAEQGTGRLWLLTTSAAPFFEKLGWRVAARDKAPEAISRSQQFSALCPASATLMVRAL